jgi:hypothetical protein
MTGPLLITDSPLPLIGKQKHALLEAFDEACKVDDLFVNYARRVGGQPFFSAKEAILTPLGYPLPDQVSRWPRSDCKSYTQQKLHGA